MKILTQIETLQALAAALHKPCMYIHFYWDTAEELKEVLLAAPYLDRIKDGQILTENSAVLVFETEGEMYQAYKKTIGDDGPTKENPYTGPARVYALTCGADGKLITENT